jgi:hypothetical protein
LHPVKVAHVLEADNKQANIELVHDDQHFVVSNGDWWTTVRPYISSIPSDSATLVCHTVPRLCERYEDCKCHVELTKQCHTEGTGPKDGIEPFKFYLKDGRIKIDHCGCWGGAHIHCDDGLPCGRYGKC